MLVSEMMLVHLRYLYFGCNHRGWLQKLRDTVGISKIVLALLVGYTSAVTLAVPAQRLAFLEASVSLVVAAGIYSSTSSVVFYTRQGRELVECCHGLIAVAEEVEAVSGPEQKTALGAAGRSGYWELVRMQVYGGVGATFISFTMLYRMEPPVHMWLRPLHAGSPGAILGVIIFLLVLWISSKVLVDFMVLVRNVALGSAALHRAVAAELSAARDGAAMQRWARLFGRTGAATRRLCDVLGSHMAHCLAFTLVSSALSTCALVLGATHPLLYVTIPVVFIFYLPICLAGDVLEETSGSLVQGSAYRGPWLELESAARRSLLLLLAAPPQRVRMEGIATLNGPTSFSTMTTWFKCLQMLINVQRLQRRN